MEIEMKRGRRWGETWTGQV